MAYNDFPPNVPHFSSGVSAIMGVEGTLGTSDTGGTAKVLPIGVNPATGAAYVEDLSGAGGTTNVQIVGGTITSGTFSLVPLSGVVLTTAVAVGTTVTALPTTTLTSRKSLIFFNDGTAVVYVGGTGVAATGAGRGIPVAVNDYSPSFDVGTTTLHGIGAAVGGTAVVMEIS